MGVNVGECNTQHHLVREHYEVATASDGERGSKRRRSSAGGRPSARCAGSARGG